MNYKVMFVDDKNKLHHYSTFSRRHRAILEMEKLFYSGLLNRVYVLDGFIIVAELERSNSVSEAFSAR